MLALAGQARAQQAPPEVAGAAQQGAAATTTINGVPVHRGAAAGAQQSDTPTISVNVRLVNLFVNVTDANGAPVPGLEKQNFVLTDDGRPQAIAHFEKQSAVPLALVLAIDTSASTRKDMSVEQHAARDFVRAILRPVDQLALFDFNSDVREIVPFTNTPKRVEEGLGNLSHGPATAFYAAVLLGSQTLAPKEGRKVLLLISDGSNTVAGTNYQQALEEAERGEVMIYSIIDVPIAADAGRDTDGEHAMITLSEETGGRYYYADSEHLDAVFRQVSDDLRTQYLLGFYPSRAHANADPIGGGGDSFHALGVKLTGLPSGAVYTPHSRSGYYSK